MLIGVGVGAEGKKKVWGNGFSCLPVSVSGAPMLFSNAQVLTGRGSGDPNPPNHPNDWFCPKRTEAPRQQCCLEARCENFSGFRDGQKRRTQHAVSEKRGQPTGKTNRTRCLLCGISPGPVGPRPWISGKDFLCHNCTFPSTSTNAPSTFQQIAHMPSMSNFHHHRFQQNENPSGVSVNIADSHSAAKGSTPLGGV